MEFRALICAAIGFAVAGAVVSLEIADSDYWVPLSFGILGLVFGVGAYITANEEAESIAVPALAVVIAAFAIFQGVQAMNDFKNANNEVEQAQDQLDQSLEGLPSLTQ